MPWGVSNHETIRLPDGDYSVESSRGPEYMRRTQRVRIVDDLVGSAHQIDQCT